MRTKSICVAILLAFVPIFVWSFLFHTTSTTQAAAMDKPGALAAAACQAVYNNGVSDIYLYNLSSRQTYAITDLYTGAQGITPLSPVLLNSSASSNCLCAFVT